MPERAKARSADWAPGPGVFVLSHWQQFTLRKSCSHYYFASAAVTTEFNPLTALSSASCRIGQTAFKFGQRTGVHNMVHGLSVSTWADWWLCETPLAHGSFACAVVCSKMVRHLNRVNMRSALLKSTWMTSQRVEDNIFPTENCPNKIVLTTKTSLFPPVGKKSVKIIFPSENQVSNIAWEYDYCITHYGQFSWSLNMILPSVLRHCRLRVKKSAQTVKIEWWGVGDWCGYLSGARCRWFAYGPIQLMPLQSQNHIISCRI